MKHFKLRLSLRFKLLLLLVSLPLITLSLYLVMATDLFQQDKIAYVFDSSATVSRALATQTRMELQNVYSGFRGVAEHFDIDSGDFSPTGKNMFQNNARMHALVLIRRQADGSYRKIAQIGKEAEFATKFLDDTTQIDQLREQTAERTVVVRELPNSPSVLVVGFRFGEKTEENHLIALGLYQSDDLINAFQGSGSYSSFVASPAGDVAVGSMDVIATDLELLQPLLQNTANEGTSEMALSDGSIYLISFASVGMGDLRVISRVDKSKALKAVQVLIAKSILFFIALGASTLLISVFASSQLTSTIRELFEATRKVAQGDFNIQVKPKSTDEVGGLAESFNWMAAEVSRLLNETAEKARMESELSTVKTVQETLFPPSQSQFGPVSIAGHFEPASECGGDWWSYSRVGNKVFIWIGDATGHGAPAALITSAARSASAVIECLPDITPGSALSILNRAIHQTSKGQIMMTFFIACIDLENRRFSYASASHDPPYLMRKSGGKITKKDLRPLNDVNGPRLGEKKDHIYEETEVEFQSGDIIFFYTDGILDVQDPNGKKWGERTFLKTLMDKVNTEPELNAKLGGICKEIEQFRGGAQLIDDVTMVICEYQERAA